MSMSFTPKANKQDQPNRHRNSSGISTSCPIDRSSLDAHWTSCYVSLSVSHPSQSVELRPACNRQVDAFRLPRILERQG